MMIVKDLFYTECFLDSVGNLLLPNDIVRMFHFKDSRGKKYYMYKLFENYYQTQSGIIKAKWKHLGGEGGFWTTMGEYKNDMVVVERGKFRNNFTDKLKRNKKLRD